MRWTCKKNRQTCTDDLDLVNRSICYPEPSRPMRAKEKGQERLYQRNKEAQFRLITVKTNQAPHCSSPVAAANSNMSEEASGKRERSYAGICISWPCMHARVS